MAVMDPNLTVLVVDDIRKMRRTLREMLRLMGFKHILEADDGDVALQKLRGNLVDLVISDWAMPRMGGLSLLKAVREDDKLARVPFLMVSEEMKEAEVAAAGEGAVDAYILKPFTAQMLHDKIAEVLERRSAPTAIDTQLSLGLVYLQHRQFDEAQQCFRAALAENPKSPRTLLAMGQWHQAQGDLQKAKECYQAAVKLSPKYVKAHEALATLCRLLDDKDEALSHLQAAVRISPKNVDRQIELGQILAESGRPEEAQQVFRAAMREARDQYAEVAQKVGEACMRAGLNADAEEAFQQALAARPQDIHLYNRLGIAFRQQGKIKEAVANYQRALRLAPNNENLYYNLSRAYYQGQDLASAHKSLARALDLRPDFPEAREMLSLVQGQMQAMDA
ncbi:MAG: tetratricopeptide repeat protein [Desulfarculus sp.]|nr:tetratricopeptide repeat protein [Desulfarculus sp.]